MILEYSKAGIVKVKNKSYFSCEIRIDDKYYLVNSRKIQIDFNSFYSFTPDSLLKRDRRKNIRAESQAFNLIEDVANKSKTSILQKIVKDIPIIILPTK